MSLSKLLSEFQATSPSAVMDSTGQAGPRTYKYATYLSVVKALAPLATKGVSWHHLVESKQGANGMMLKVTTVLQHEADKMSAVIMVDCPPNIQTMGSYITYLKRYQLSALVGLTSDEDDDGKTADDEQKTIAQAAAGSRIRPAKSAEPARAEAPSDPPTKPAADIHALAMASIRDADTSAKRQQILATLGVRLKEKKIGVKDYMELVGKVAARTNDGHELSMNLLPIVKTVFDDFGLDESQWSQLQSTFNIRIKGIAAAAKIGGTMKEEG